MDLLEKKLKAAVERHYGGPAHLAYIDAVSPMLQARPVCEGMVFVFDLAGHPDTDRAYGWASPVGKDGERQLHAVLHIPPIASAQDAVRCVLVAASQSATNRGTSPSAPALHSPPN